MEIEDVYPLAGYAKSINFTLIPNHNFFTQFRDEGRETLVMTSFRH